MFFQSLISNTGEASFVLSRWIFLRLLGLICLAAFISFWVQAKGLVGSAGILPMTSFLQRVSDYLGPSCYWRCPTVFWLNSSNAAIYVVCTIGVIASLMLTVGLAPIPALIVIWSLYLSITVAGQQFMSFQWDMLLIETCFLAVFLAPPQWMPGLGHESLAPVAARFLLWWLLFRLMFESGVLKLTSGDVNWSHLTALKYHYFSQPLPTWIGWYAHHLPGWFNRLSVLIVLIIEAGLPLFIFAWRPLRILACSGIVFLMILVMLTGNYTFFNPLTIALSLFLVDDAIWVKVLPDWLLNAIGYTGGVHASAGMFHTGVALAIALLFVVVGGAHVLSAIFPRSDRLPKAEYMLNILEPLRSLNSYGLFRVMTTVRHEIVVEGSIDGHTWLAYEFKYKPGNLYKRPGFVEPHQPRLDWQMWFAALSSPEREVWFENFLVRLLQGSHDVLSLISVNPFPDTPPRWVRAMYYDYEPTSMAEHRENGAWWKRKLLGTFFPEIQL